MGKVDVNSMTPEQRAMFERAQAKFHTPDAQAREPMPSDRV